MLGKAVKLAEGHLDTHSHKVAMNKEFLCEVAQSAGVDNAKAILDSITMARELWILMPQAFFDRIHELCLQHCRSVFPNNDLQIHLICDSQA
jgi:cobalt-precorrin-5B (C1)-methyltransferase